MNKSEQIIESVGDLKAEEQSCLEGVRAFVEEN